MRPTDSTYDRDMSSAEVAAHTFLEGLVVGALVDHEDTDELVRQYGDAAWHAIKDQLVEVPGEGHRYVGTGAIEIRAIDPLDSRGKLAATLDGELMARAENQEQARTRALVVAGLPPWGVAIIDRAAGRIRWGERTTDLDGNEIDPGGGFDPGDR